MTRPVVVGLDGSAESAAAAEWAAAEALRRTAPLRLVSACGRAPAADMAPETPDALRRATERLLTRTRDELLAGHRRLAVFGEAVVEGPVVALVEGSRHAELVVLGSRGLGAFAGFVLGSVSAPVIVHAACPVVVVRARTRVGGGAGSEVVMGLKHLGDPASEVLDFAFGAADRQGLALRVVHTWRATLPPSPHRLAPPGASEEGERHASALVDALRPWQVSHPNVAVRRTLLPGNASQALIGAADRAALIVVGRGGRQTGHGQRVGSVVHALLHHSAAPVAVVPHN